MGGHPRDPHGRPATTTGERRLLREVVIKQLLFGFVGGFFLSIPTILDYLWPLWDDENRALHDMIAASRVIRGLARVAAAPGRQPRVGLGQAAAPISPSATSVAMICSRPGPTPMKASGTPTKSLTNSR